jgi:hypothetical protein
MSIRSPPSAATIERIGRYVERWICACDEMKNWKYCQCLPFVTPEDRPITEYLPENHEGRQTYGLVKDPTPGNGRESAGRNP